ncbi:MAG: ADP-forming succinate--CoA ligase subunit beta [Desulfobacterales bacterium]|nr:ADP-forming succinate--CoA ligase subunit beta [Desulfobacterales bacterium]
MKIHEYQAKEFFKRYGIPIPEGAPALDYEEALRISDSIGSLPVVVKAQIHAGGRGKGGGVKLAHSLDEVRGVISQILGMKLITHQTGKEGKIVNKLLIEQGVKIKKELYLSIIPDRETAKIVIIASEAGGMDIEEVALNTPDKIIKSYISPLIGIEAFNCREIGFGLNLSPSCMKQMSSILTNLYRLFIDYDCSLIEINPLIITDTDSLVALDAKINFDDNALFRHKDLFNYRDIDEEEPLEVEASKYNLNYIKMDGNVGNMVNGAGLAMATMDIIKLAGASPANFLDVGGGASAEMVENGFKIILSDKNVKGIFINIFGGILRCDVLAKGLVQAAKNIKLNLPVVIRMEGTNVEEGRTILRESDLNLISALDLQDAVQKVAEIVK